VVCAIPGEVEEGEKRHHIMANHSDIQPALSTCLWQLCVIELVVQYLIHDQAYHRTLLTKLLINRQSGYMHAGKQKDISLNIC